MTTGGPPRDWLLKAADAEDAVGSVAVGAAPFVVERPTPEHAQRARELYETWIGPIRETAKALGYAVGVHGSLARDIDLIAIPWTKEAVTALELAEAIRVLVDGHYSWNMKGRDFTVAGCPGTKPHGRLGWAINIGLNHGPAPYIDLSVMPRITEES